MRREEIRPSSDEIMKYKIPEIRQYCESCLSNTKVTTSVEFNLAGNHILIMLSISDANKMDILENFTVEHFDEEITEYINWHLETAVFSVPKHKTTTTYGAATFVADKDDVKRMQAYARMRSTFATSLFNCFFINR